VACYVDRLIDYTGRVPYRHKVWCHLVADSDQELLACAAELGLSEAWLQGSRSWDTHFDLPAPLRPAAMQLGAVEVDFRFMGRRTRARRSALKLDADLAAGAPAGTAMEVPLPPGDWGVTSVPPGLEVGWRAEHPLLGDGPVVVVGAADERHGVITFAASGGVETRVGVVFAATTRPPGGASR